MRCGIDVDISDYVSPFSFDGSFENLKASDDFLASIRKSQRSSASSLPFNILASISEERMLGEAYLVVETEIGHVYEVSAERDTEPIPLSRPKRLSGWLEAMETRVVQMILSALPSHAPTGEKF